MTRTLIALFDNRPQAERAVETLVQEFGLAREAVQVHAAGEANASAGTDARRAEDHHGFVAEGGRPGIQVSARLPDDALGRAEEAFRRHGAREVRGEAGTG
ncbi:MAG TPA: hypothetical protein VE684_14725 [Crenalkalicoccus sp.]|jgi:hypothetical protein|nr:hypothetical protein [Crenalkalicoccus sp.]